MGVSQAVRLKTPEEIAVQAGEQVQYVRLPERASVFADRATRLRERAASHSMRDFLLFMADVAQCQHESLQHYPDVVVPDAAAVRSAAGEAAPLLPASTWPRDGVWVDELRGLLDRLLARLEPSPVRTAVEALRSADDERLNLQADRLLNGVMFGLDMAAAPLIAAGLQTYWTHLVLTTQAAHGGQPASVRMTASPFGRTLRTGHCPCCGSLPSASISRVGSENTGHRYQHCSLCSAQWHMVRIKCSHCESTKGIHYQSLQAAADGAVTSSKFKPAVEAETCDECGHYLKIVHMERDLHVDPIADDLATVALDLLVSEAGFERHGVNLMLLYGDPDTPDPGDP